MTEIKAECQATIDSKGFVCRRCGGPLVPIRTVDNSGTPTYWSGCRVCNVYDHGVSPQVFRIASAIVRADNRRGDEKEAIGSLCVTVRQVIELLNV